MNQPEKTLPCMGSKPGEVSKPDFGRPGMVHYVCFILFGVLVASFSFLRLIGVDLTVPPDGCVSIACGRLKPVPWLVDVLLFVFATSLVVWSCLRINRAAKAEN
jgi:hypothetical protein